jgi:SAM-dependent methyltransferase
VTHRSTLATLGSRLRYGGLSPRALAAWAGSDRLSALPALLPTRRPLTPASALLALFVAGDDVPIDRIADVEALHHAKLVDVAGSLVHARVSLLPLGQSLVVCDRLDTSDSLDIVCWPDDSSYHLALSLPQARHKLWLDLGCGSAFAPLLRPELAESIVAADINERAVAYADLGCELSGIAHVDAVKADLADGVPVELRGSCELVTCNAPIPDPGGSPYRARWRQTDTSFIERLLVQARTFVAPEGMIVVHAALDALEPVLDELTGHRVVVSYTPSEVRGFAIAWWRPDGEDRLVRAYRPLTQWRPHLTHEDRLGAMTRTLADL